MWGSNLRTHESEDAEFRQGGSPSRLPLHHQITAAVYNVYRRNGAPPLHFPSHLGAGLPHLGLPFAASQSPRDSRHPPHRMPTGSKLEKRSPTGVMAAAAATIDTPVGVGCSTDPCLGLTCTASSSISVCPQTIQSYHVHILTRLRWPLAVVHACFSKGRFRGIPRLARPGVM